VRLTETEAVILFGPQILEQKPKAKYRNKKCSWKGIEFDSIKERDRFIILHDREVRGEITDLNRQVRFQLLPVQKDEKGKVIERACFYVADFTYRENGIFIAEDVKSPATKTQVYKLKKKLMLWFHGIKIQEV